MTHPNYHPQTLAIEANGMYPALCGARNAYSYLFWVPWNEVQTVAIQPVVEEVIEVERPTEVIKKQKLMDKLFPTIFILQIGAIGLAYCATFAPTEAERLRGFLSAPGFQLAALVLFFYASWKDSR